MKNGNMLVGKILNFGGVKEVDEDCMGVVFHDNTKFADWEVFGMALQALHTSLGWVIGDWLNYGETVYGEKYAQALNDTGKQQSTLQNYSYVCRKIPLEHRRKDLSFTAHLAACGAGDLKQVIAVLKKADKEGWTSSEIRAHVRSLKEGAFNPDEETGSASDTKKDAPEEVPAVIDGDFQEVEDVTTIANASDYEAVALDMQDTVERLPETIRAKDEWQKVGDILENIVAVLRAE